MRPAWWVPWWSSYETYQINLIFSLVNLGSFPHRQYIIIIVFKNLKRISYKCFYFILLKIFSYVYFREMGKNKWWFNSLILYLFTNCYLLCMFSGTTPIFINTSITQINEPHSHPIVLTDKLPINEPLHCWLLCWMTLLYKSYLLLNEFPDHLPMKLVRLI